LWQFIAKSTTPPQFQLGLQTTSKIGWCKIQRVMKRLLMTVSIHLGLSQPCQKEV
jgi:hypothetical protein